MPITLRVGDLVRQQGLTIKALAARAGIAYNTAHTLATGRATRIDLDTLDRICAALEVEPGTLLVRTGRPERPDPHADSHAATDEQLAGDGDWTAHAGNR